MYQIPKSRNLGINICVGCLEKQQEINRKDEEIKSLKAKLRYREARGKKAFGSSTPSSRVAVKANSLEENQAKRGGAKKGHVGHGRKSASEQSADRVEEIVVEGNCPDCGEELNSKGQRERTVKEIRPVEPEQILYKLQRKQCPHCQRTVQAKAPGVLPKSEIGNRLLSELMVCHYLHGIPLGRLCEKYGLNLGTVIQMLHRVGNLFEGIIPKLIEEYRQTEVRHADETGWRTDGRGGYAWLFTTSDLSLFLYRQTRSARVAKEVLGEKPLGGVLVVDRYNAYNKAPVQLQYCYAHLMRDVDDMVKEFPDDQEVSCFGSTMIPLLAAAMHLRSKAITDKQYYQQAKRLKSQIMATVNAQALHQGIIKVQDIFRDNPHRLYHWVENRAVPAENNRAERELRPTVIARKVSFGSQSEAGAKTRERLQSLVQTLKKRAPNPAQWLKTVLDKYSADISLDPVELILATISG